MRTTATAVKAILGANYGSFDGGATEPDPTPYMETASAVVDDLVTYAALRLTPTTFTSARKELIERWLSAFFYCEMDPLYISSGQGGANGAFQRGPQALGFEKNDYGSAACKLDPTGTLRALGLRQVASGFSMGTAYKDQPTVI